MKLYTKLSVFLNIYTLFSDYENYTVELKSFKEEITQRHIEPSVRRHKDAQLIKTA